MNGEPGCGKQERQHNVIGWRGKSKMRQQMRLSQEPAMQQYALRQDMVSEVMAIEPSSQRSLKNETDSAWLFRASTYNNGR
jgi:hypothetical protein